MASANVVVADTNSSTPAVGSVFEGLKFFLVQRLPSRSSFVQRVEANGGRVVKLEAQADHIIADHLRNDCPAGSLSYTFIESAIKDGNPPDPQDHLAGAPSGTVREAGSSVAGRSTRTPFTAEDDRVLWQWVEKCKKNGDRMVKGNEIYKQLEQKNGRHTYQAWRDRYIKKLMDKPPPGVEVVVPANAPPTPPGAQDEQREIALQSVGEQPEVQADEEVPTTATAEERGESIQKQTQAVASEGRAALAVPDEQIEVAVDDGQIETTAPDDPTKAANPGNLEEAPVPDQQPESALREEQQEAAMPKQQPESANPVKQAEAVLPNKRLTTPSREPSTQHEAARDFTAEEQASLLQFGADIVRIHPSQEKDAWKTWARLTSTHSWQAWRKLWLEVVLPKWEEQRELQTQSADSGESEALETGLAVQERAPPADKSRDVVFERRKRNRDDDDDDEAPRDTTPGSRKRRRSDRSPSAAGEEASKLDQGSELQRQYPRPTQIIDLAGSDSDSNADEQMPALSARTSDLNQLAQEQLNNEAARNHDPQAAETDLPAPEISTSEGHLAVSQQVLQESLEDSREDSPALEQRSRGDLLTEENLASQQAMHRASLSLRGTDLPEDDDDKDGEQQEEYIRMLREIIQPNSHDQVQPANEGINDTTNGGALPFQPERNDPDVDDAESEPLVDLQMSSQEELDDAMFTALNWPASPVRPSRREATVQSLQFETQVAYPQLPSQQSSMRPEIAYSLLNDYMEESQPIEQAGLVDEEMNGQDVADNRQEDGEPDSSPLEEHPELPLRQALGGWIASSPSRFAASQVSDAISSRQAAEPTPQALDAEVDEGEQEDEDEAADELTSPSSASSSEAPFPRRSNQNLTPKLTTQLGRRTVMETQDILNAETQAVDLGMLLPSDSEQEVEAESSQNSVSSPGRRWSKEEDELLLRGMKQGMTMHQILRTFNIDRTESALRNRRKSLLKQTPEQLNSQSDESDDNEDLPANPFDFIPPRPQPPATESQANSSDEDFETWFTRMVVVLQYPEAAVFDAIKRTSMRPELAEFVLLEAKAGREFPADVPGIWSVEEDSVLESGDAKGLRKLEEKHGWEICVERMRTLVELRE